MLYSLQFKIGVHLLNAELLQLLTPVLRVLHIIDSSSDPFGQSAWNKRVYLYGFPKIKGFIILETYHSITKPVFWNTKSSLGFALEINRLIATFKYWIPDIGCGIIMFRTDFRRHIYDKKWIKISSRRVWVTQFSTKVWILIK